MTRTRAAVVCVSLANLCHLGLWTGLFSADFRFYLHDSLAFTAVLTGILVSVAVMSVIGFGISVAAQAHPRLRAAARGGCFLVLTIPAWTAICTFVPGLAENISPRYLLTEFFAFGSLGVLWHLYPQLRRAAYSATAAAVLTLPLFTAEGARLISQLPRSTMRSDGLLSIDSSVAASSPSALAGSATTRSATTLNATRPRLIWFLFDELDQYATFESKAGVPLPEFEKFRQSAFHAGHAVPANYMTVAAVPSMLSGRAISQVSATSADSRDWVSPDGLFSILRKEGKSAAILGWYLPYCTILGSELSRCYSVIETAAPPPGVGWATRIFRQWRQIGRSAPLCATLYRFVHTAFFPEVNLPNLDVSRHKSAYDLLHARFAEFVVGSYDVVLVHWPVPHMPGIARPQGASGGLPADYLDNLLLADASLGEFRRTLETAKLWDDATIVVTGDHHYRANMWRGGEGVPPRVDRAIDGQEHARVPVLIKLPHRQDGVAYDKPFSTLLMRDLMLNLSGGKFSAPADIAAWLDENRDRFPDPKVP